MNGYAEMLDCGCRIPYKFPLASGEGDPCIHWQEELMDCRDYGRDVNEKYHSSRITESDKKERKTGEKIRTTQNDVRENQTRKRGRKAQTKKNRGRKNVSDQEN